MTREEEIKARAEAATPGPWTLGDDADIKAEGTSIAGLLNTLNDAEFITNVREDIPYLLDRLEFMTEAYDRNAEVHETLTRDYVTMKGENERLRAELEAASDSECDKCRFKTAKRGMEVLQVPVQRMPQTDETIATLKGEGHG